MKQQIEKEILGWIGKDEEIESLLPIDNEDTECRKEYAVRIAHNKALADLRLKAPQLAEEILDTMYPEYNQSQIKVIVQALEDLHIPENAKEYNFIRIDLLKRFKKSLKS